jgi:glycosyltransferase involved in cell wall biosynthesis
MRIALGMIVKNEREILEKTLNYKALDFDLRLAIDYMSSDYTVELLGSYGFQVIRQEWGNNYGNARNSLIQFAEEQGADYLFMLDADEALFSKDIATLKQLAEHEPAITVPRVEFVRDFGTYQPNLAPDYQCRFFRLNQDYYYKGKIHEMLTDNNGKALIKSATVSQSTPIYHYSRVGDKRKLALKYINYDRTEKKLPALTELPSDIDIATIKLWGECKAYPYPHPLKKYAPTTNQTSIRYAI